MVPVLMSLIDPDQHFNVAAFFEIKHLKAWQDRVMLLLNIESHNFGFVLNLVCQQTNVTGIAPIVHGAGS